MTWVVETGYWRAVGAGVEFVVLQTRCTRFRRRAGWLVRREVELITPTWQSGVRIGAPLAEHIPYDVLLRERGGPPVSAVWSPERTTILGPHASR